MPVPKKRQGHQRQMTRRANWKAAIPTYTTCSNCGASIPPHTACAHCGYWKGALKLKIKQKQPV